MYRWLNSAIKGCGMFPGIDPSSPAANGRGHMYQGEGVGHVFDAEEPEHSEGDGGLFEGGDGWGHLQAFVSSVSAGEVDAIVQRLTP